MFGAEAQCAGGLGRQEMRCALRPLPGAAPRVLNGSHAVLPRPPAPPRPSQFCYRLTREAGVTLIPISAFYDDRAAAPRTLVRFAFCKTDEKLQEAVAKLRAYFGGGGGSAAAAAAAAAQQQ